MCTCIIPWPLTSVTNGGEAPYYFSYGATVTEVELDVLTGQTQISRVDLLYDCGDRLVLCVCVVLPSTPHLLLLLIVSIPRLMLGR